MHEVTDAIDVIVCDVSFISIIVILEKLKTLLEAQTNKFITKPELIFLLKPQFEAGKEIMDKCQGVIKDKGIRDQVCQNVIRKITDLGFIIEAQTPSPIKGAKGNVEYLMLLKRS
jgi:23S rRNA (cytidine1920-2'-O)/16S rRNA (cytidine1409-2'-O)-methyltransferase